MSEPGNALARFWTPQHEQQFQTYMAFDPGVRQWRNAFTTKFGEQPDMSGNGDFNYRQAYLANDGPRFTASDNIPHWGSAGKKAGHPTEWMQRFFERFNGADPTTLPAHQWTPEMKQFVQQEMQGNYVNALAQPGNYEPLP